MHSRSECTHGGKNWAGLRRRASGRHQIYRIARLPHGSLSHFAQSGTNPAHSSVPERGVVAVFSSFSSLASMDAEGDGMGGGGDSEETARTTAEKRMLKEALGEILNEIPAFREWAAASKAKKKAPGKGKGPRQARRR